MTWSAKYGEYESGDPELHHVAGTLYAEGERQWISFMRPQLKESRLRTLRSGATSGTWHERFSRAAS